MDFQTADDFIGAFVQATQYEAESMFFQGDLLYSACEPDVLARLGYRTQDALLLDVARAVGREKRTMWKRLQVSRTFAPEDRNDRVSWECHWIASTTDDPAYWLAQAADLEMTNLQLKMAIKAAGGEPDRGETVSICKAADAEVVTVSDNGRRLVLHIPGGVEVAQGTAVVVTIALVQSAAQTATVAQPADWIDALGVTDDEIVDIVRGELPAHQEAVTT